MSWLSRGFSGVGALGSLYRTGRLSWRLMRDPRVSAVLKLGVVGGLLVYVFSPLDLIPDFIPLVGELDDIGVVLLGLGLFIRLCPGAVVEEHEAALAG